MDVTLTFRQFLGMRSKKGLRCTCIFSMLLDGWTSMSYSTGVLLKATLTMPETFRGCMFAHLQFKNKILNQCLDAHF